MLDSIRSFFRLLNSDASGAELQARLADARRRTPTPVIWLFGKTQSGKTSIIKFLTGATEAEIGNGFKPCTRYSRLYDFPTSDAPLLTFLDTRGLDEPGYDPSEDIERLDDQAHLIVVTVKVLDHAQERIKEHLETIRHARPNRPVILALTNLHEAYPQQQHPAEYPFINNLYPESVPEDLRRTIAEQEKTFRGLADVVVPIDLTKPEEGYEQPNYGGDILREEILKHLPEAFRQTMVSLDQLTGELRDAYVKQAMPTILAYSYLAAGAGAIPIPFVDLFLLPGIQAKMVNEIGKLYGQPMTAQRFSEAAGALGLGLLSRQAARELSKFIPWVGIAAGAALAGASTYALGRAFCYYYQEVHEGHVPDPSHLKQYFEKELAGAEKIWGKKPTEGAK